MVLIIGPGGSGGGGAHPVVTAIHAGLRSLTRNLEVKVLQIGPEISLLDKNRQVSANQEIHVPENVGSNWSRLLSDFRCADRLVEDLPQLSHFSLPAQDRVGQLTALDRSNGRHTFTTIDDFIPMVAQQLLLSTLTPASGWIAARRRDLNALGDTKQGQFARPVVDSIPNQGDLS